MLPPPALVWPLLLLRPSLLFAPLMTFFALLAKASVPVPAFELEGTRRPDASEETPSLEDGAAVPVYLGNIVRLSRDRKHPEDLAAEASDVLMTVLTGTVSEVVDRVLEDLLEEDEGQD